MIDRDKAKLVFVTSTILALYSVGIYLSAQGYKYRPVERHDYKHKNIEYVVGHTNGGKIYGNR